MGIYLISNRKLSRSPLGYLTSKKEAIRLAKKIKKRTGNKPRLYYVARA